MLQLFWVLSQYYMQMSRTNSAFIFENVLLPKSNRVTTSLISYSIKIISPVSLATSVPESITIPKLAFTSYGASLIPSSTRQPLQQFYLLVSLI